MSIGYINDGYSESSFIAEVKRLHPALRFKFRPFLQEERHRLLKENAGLQPIKAAENSAKILAKKISEWDLKDSKGDPVAVSDNAIRRLKPALYDRVLGIVMGLDPSDEDPEAREVDSPSLADQLEANETGKPIGDVADANAVKN